MSGQIQERYLEGTLYEEQQGAQMIVPPELAVWLAAEDEPALLSRSEQIAKDNDVYLAISYSVEHEDGSSYANKLVMIDPADMVVLEHLKFGRQMIEGFESGDSVLRTVETPFGTLSGMICWDTSFEKAVSQAGRNGTDILLPTGLEFPAVEPMHSQTITFRAIENGISLVRVADNGIFFVTDPYGKTLAWVDYFSTSKPVMVAQIPTHHVTIEYLQIGELFAWLVVAGFVGIVAVGIFQTRQARQ